MASQHVVSHVVTAEAALQMHIAVARLDQVGRLIGGMQVLNLSSELSDLK